MIKKHIRDTPKITVYKGYDVEDVIDTDDVGYDHGEPTITQEIEIDYEREERKE